MPNPVDKQYSDEYLEFLVNFKCPNPGEIIKEDLGPEANCTYIQYIHITYDIPNSPSDVLLRGPDPDPT